MIVLKVNKNQGLTLSLEDKFSEIPQGGSSQHPASRFKVNTRLC